MENMPSLRVRQAHDLANGAMPQGKNQAPRNDHIVTPEIGVKSI
jgi:hypothetical protein